MLSYPVNYLHELPIVGEGLAFLAIVVVALDAVGGAILRLLIPSLARDHGMRLAYGIAAYLAYSGYLEVTQLAGRATLLAPVGIGLIISVITAARSNRTRIQVSPPSSTPLSTDWLATSLFILFGLLFLLFLINVADWTYISIDDRHGYLVFPERILGEGSIGRDPFQFRRIESGLSSGGAYLYALFRTVLELRQTRLVDAGLGSICLLLLVHGHAREYRASRLQLAVALLTALWIIIFSPISNNTPDTIGKALLYALFRVCLSSINLPPTRRRAAAVACVTFAIVALKTSYLPEAAAAVFAFYIAAMMQQRPAAIILEVITTCAVGLCLALPSMLVSQQIASTLWYPLLGIGTLRPEEADGITAGPRFIRDAGRLLFLLALPLYIANAVWRKAAWHRERLFLVLLAIFAILFTALTQLKFTIFGYRYGQMGPATLLLFGLVVSLRGEIGPAIRGAVTAMLGLSLILVAVSNWSSRMFWLRDGLVATAMAAPRPDDPIDWRDSRQQEYRLMQQTVPASEPLLAILSWPSLLDFHRNPILVMDWPAMIGPPPLPAPDDPAAWLAYLTRHGIKYVAYSYGDEGGLHQTDISNSIAKFSRPETFSGLQVALMSRAAQMHETLLALRELGTVVYDDGQQFVVRLPEPTPVTTTHPSP